MAKEAKIYIRVTNKEKKQFKKTAKNKKFDTLSQYVLYILRCNQ